MLMVFHCEYYTRQETQVWLQYALSCDYIDKQTNKSLDDKYDHIIAMIVNMSSNPEKWSW